MRIHFTVTDLARTRLAPAPSPLAVTTLGACRLRHGPGDAPGLDLWRRTVEAARAPAAPDRAGGSVTAARPGAFPPLGGLAATAPSHPVPRLLRPHTALPTLDEELERLLATPRAELRADLGYVASRRPLPRWARALADGRPAALRRLADAVRAYHEVAVAPYWRELHAAIGAEQARRARQLQEGGIELVLDTLHPAMRWRPPYLELSSPNEDVYHLGGRGLVLAPGAFTAYLPCDPGDDRPTLHYAAVPHPPLDTLTGPHRHLAALLGHSRAAVLEAVAEGCSTSQLARRVGLSPASASEHATVLRSAGLVETHRRGRAAHHTLTPLGAELLLHSASGRTPEPVGRTPARDRS
ncbi:ArsR family transcriptional regulator [Streptomyces sp. NHF165]|uniref:ArsR/SmtB family transcription factor n=1 Tax=Streptomyces sp. NHF165 TaxID=2175864 RepID=UPI00132EC67A|nr:winged helix-turn-helix domain-containing protein [Streptomyces sp. NHF165]QHF92690.1 ArsR family transcriptional regulator [Streptomyces sp. NHF165]